jgi:hypothetical protein
VSNQATQKKAPVLGAKIAKIFEGVRAYIECDHAAFGMIARPLG